MGFENSFEHSEELMEAALHEFAARGYEQASINAILDAAGMSKGQFYYHFKNKEDLYLSLIDVLIARKSAFLNEVMTPDDLQGDIFSILHAQIRYGVAFTRENPAIGHFSESFVREKGNEIYRKAMAIHNFEESNFLDRMIEDAHRKGELRDDLPLAFIKKVMGFLFTHVAEVIDLDDPETSEENLHNLIAFMKTGLSRHSGS